MAYVDFRKGQLGQFKVKPSRPLTERAQQVEEVLSALSGLFYTAPPQGSVVTLTSTLQLRYT